MTEFEQMQIEQLKRIADVLEDINGTLIGMSGDIEGNHRLRQLHALIYRMHERDVADRLRTERQEGKCDE